MEIYRVDYEQLRPIARAIKKLRMEDRTDWVAVDTLCNKYPSIDADIIRGAYVNRGIDGMVMEIASVELKYDSSYCYVILDIPDLAVVEDTLRAYRTLPDDESHWLIIKGISHLGSALPGNDFIPEKPEVAQ